MSASWIKLRTDLDTDPRVLTMADFITSTSASYVLNPSARDLLGVTPTVTRNAMRDITLASLFRVWRDANRHTSDGVFHHCTLEHLDTIAQIPGFGRAMAAIGWAIEDTTAHTVTLVNFLEMNHPTKETRSTAAIRQKRYRDKKRDVTPPVTDDITDPVDRDRETELSTLPPIERERPQGFPDSEEKARSIATTIGVDPDFAATVWLEIEGRGGTDDRGHRVTNFAAHVKARFNYRQNRLAGQRPPPRQPGQGEVVLDRKVGYARYMAAKDEIKKIKTTSYHDPAQQKTAAERLHALERQITELETQFEFTA